MKQCLTSKFLTVISDLPSTNKLPSGVSKINEKYLDSFVIVDSSSENFKNTSSIIKIGNMLHTAISVSRNSTCSRHHVGAVVLSDNIKIISSGWNGVKSGETHCKDLTGKITYLEHYAWSLINEVHAEVNTLTPFINTDDHIGLVVSSSPCINCVNFILKNFVSITENKVSSRIKFVAFAHPYKDYMGSIARLINESHGEIKVIQFTDKLLRDEVNRFAPVKNRYPRTVVP
jgi:dCMP deaminase